MRWRRDVPLAAHARYRIGGPARRFARPGSPEELASALGAVEAHRVLGTGANVLVSDSGPSRPVLVLGAGFDGIRVDAGGIEAGAAARLPVIAGAARRGARRGLHFLEAVPGTLGGGLRMNAGSRAEWLWHRVEWADAVTPGGRRVRLTPEEAAPGYRSVGVPEEWVFVAARLSAPDGDAAEVRRAHLEFRARKVGAQVYDMPSIGSTWRNPPPPHPSAWRVVDAVGMRGASVGGARIAERHANFIINTGEARAEDVLALMAETRLRARDQLGVRLEPEVRLWGFDAEERARVGAP